MAKISINYVPIDNAQSKAESNISENNRGANYCSVSIGSNQPMKPKQPEKVDQFVNDCNMNTVAKKLFQKAFNHKININKKGEI